MVFNSGEVPLSYRIRDPGTNGTTSEKIFFGKDRGAFNMPYTRLGAP